MLVISPEKSNLVYGRFWKRPGFRAYFEPESQITARRKNGLTIRFYGIRPARKTDRAVTAPDYPLSRPQARASSGPSPVRHRGSRRVAASSGGSDDDPGPEPEPPDRRPATDNLGATTAPPDERRRQ